MPSVTVTTNGRTPLMVRDAFLLAAQQQMERAMIQVEGDVKRNTPTRTGHLRRAITHTTHRRGDVIIGVVGTDVRYGAYVDRGTGLYGPYKQRIYPKRKGGYLRFPAVGNAGFTLSGRQRSGKAGAGARYTFVRSTKGMRPTHFFQHGIEQSRGAWTREMRNVPAVARRILKGGR